MPILNAIRQAVQSVARLWNDPPNAAASYVVSNLKKDVALVYPSLALVGRIAKAGSRKVSSFMGKYGPNAWAEKAMEQMMERPVKSGKVSRKAFFLTGVAAITVIGASSAFVLPAGAALLVGFASAIGNLLCGTEHLVALREEVGPAIQILLVMGTILLFFKCCLGFKAAAKDLKELGKAVEVWETVRNFVRSAWSNDLSEATKFWPIVKSLLMNLAKGCVNAIGATSRFIFMVKRAVMFVWHYMTSRADNGLATRPAAA